MTPSEIKRLAKQHTEIALEKQRLLNKIMTKLEALYGKSFYLTESEIMSNFDTTDPELWEEAVINFIDKKEEEKEGN